MTAVVHGGAGDSARPFDLAIVGGGIIGLATAHRFLLARPDLRLVLLEKEDRLAAHQTGHNSGVVHSGLYYKPGSVKARTAVEGSRELTAFCRDHGLPLEACGKVVVATCGRELPALAELERRGRANGVRDLERIGPERLREIEPHATGLSALHVPHAAIVDFAAVARKLGELVVAAGGEIRLGARVRAMARDARGHRLETTAGEVAARCLVSCAGLQSDRVARLAGARPEARILPFRGEYYELVPERRCLVRGLIYPVPDDRFPFLGTHFTRTVAGGVEAGPNAVLALHREGYSKSRVSAADLAGMAAFPGFWRMAGRYWRTGLEEQWRSLSKRAFARSLARLVPDIRGADLVPAPSGVRAQAVNRAGRLVDDFVIIEGPAALHVLNAPSPAATASLAIADEIVRRAKTVFV